jgi:hypothetical protein
MRAAGIAVELRLDRTEKLWAVFFECLLQNPTYSSCTM